MTALRALTLIRPMSAAIVHGTKRIENRPMDLPKAMRGVETVVAVHAGKKWSEEYADLIMQIIGETEWDRLRELRLWEAEGIVGLMLLTGRVFTKTNPPPARPPHDFTVMSGGTFDPWFSGPFGYEIKHAVALASPIACRGMQGWWPVPEDIANTFDVKWARERLLDEARGMAA